MSAPKGGYCSVCRHDYRGTYLLHLSTKEHRRHAGPRITRAKSARRERVAHAYRVSRRDEGSGMIEVRRHRRSKPNDGRARVVGVRPYVRGWPYVPGGVRHSRRHARD